MSHYNRYSLVLVQQLVWVRYRRFQSKASQHTVENTQKECLSEYTHKHRWHVTLVSGGFGWCVLCSMMRWWPNTCWHQIADVLCAVIVRRVAQTASRLSKHTRILADWRHGCMHEREHAVRDGVIVAIDVIDFGAACRWQHTHIVGGSAVRADVNQIGGEQELGQCCRAGSFSSRVHVVDMVCGV